MERIYNKSATNGYTDISDNPNHPLEESALADEALYQEATDTGANVNNGWINTDGVISNTYEPQLDENAYPSEIDSLDSNYIHKNYNFDAHHHYGTYKESSPDTTDHDIGSSAIRTQKGKPLFIRTNDDKDSPNDYYSAEYAETVKSDTDRSCNSAQNITKSQTNFHVLEQSNGEFNERESSNESSPRRVSVREQNEIKSTGPSDTSESESTKSVELVTTPPDKDNISVTSYISVEPYSPDTPPRRLENLAYSLAEKIDEYCESFVEIPLNLHSVSSSFNSKSFDDLNSIYTQVKKIKPNVVKVEPKVKYKDTLERHQKSYSPAENRLYKQCCEKEKADNDILKTRSLLRQGSSSKNITTEPFVTTLIENQYYSLPDINVSKSLRHSERIDERLRQSEESDSDSYLKRLEISEEAPLSLNEADLKEISVVEVKAEEQNKNTLTQKDRTVEEAELQIHKEINGEIENEPEPTLINNDHDEQLEISIQRNLIEKISKIPCESLSEIGSSDDDRKTYFTNKVANIKHKFFKDSELKDLSNLPLIPNNYRKEFEARSKEENSKTNESETNEKHPPQTKTKLAAVSKPKTSIAKHYSLRQRDPTADNSPNISPPIEDTDSEDYSKTQTSKICLTTSASGAQTHSAAIYDVVYRENKQIQRVHSFKARTNTSFSENRDENNITILPLSGHQTIVFDGPIKLGNNPFSQTKVPKHTESNVLSETVHSPQLTTKSDDETKHSENIVEYKSSSTFSNFNSENDHYHSEGEIDYVPKKPAIPRVKKERSFRIAAVQNKFERPPTRLLIKDKALFKNIEMSRPQILNVMDTRKIETYKAKANGIENGIKGSTMHFKPQIYNVTEKVDKVVKNDLEYQEKLHSVKNYWSKLIDKSGDEIENESQTSEMMIAENSTRECLPEEVDTCDTSKSVENIVKSIETVKIVDSIKKKTTETEIIDDWKKIDEPEKEKAELEIEESAPKNIVYDSGKLARKAIKETLTIASTESCVDDIIIKEDEDYKSFSPDIEIVELRGNDRKYHGGNEVTHATLIKSRSYDQDCGQFDHVRYKVMKSDLFRNSMIAANHKKEAQFDGLLQYLQDYSFQELLVNNNIVIIEPVRTKVETGVGTKRPNSCRITSATTKHFTDLKDGIGEVSKPRKLKPGIKRHFFYHPIRVNKEIIEEELPNPDTVKTVRNMFERTLTMRRPGESSDPSLSHDSDSSKRSSSQKNLTDDLKLDKSSSRKKAIRYLTIDTSYGHRKWDSVSLSSGVSSGDLSSNNEHDYDTDALSPFPPTKENNENIYCSSSEEYLCESLNPSLCYESQYVSQDILQKIRECGTSITYYGGKVLDERTGPAVSPMTKQIMEEIRGLQRNCCRDCESCQIKCTGGKCECLFTADAPTSQSETACVIEDDTISKCCACSEIMEKNDRHQTDDKCSKTNSDNYLGFKFKLVKSNSCSSRLELAGAGDDSFSKKFRNNRTDEEDGCILYDNENSVKTKICRIESYRKGIVASPFSSSNQNEPKCEITINNQVHNLETGKIKQDNIIDKLNSKNVTVHNHRTLAEAYEPNIDKSKVGRNRNVDLAYAVNTHVGRSPAKINEIKTISENERVNSAKIEEEIIADENDDVETATIKNDSHKSNTTTTENEDVITGEQKTVAETIKCFSEPYTYEKKFYYVNNENMLNGEKKNTGKFGEMVFEEFEVLESSYESLRNAKLEKK